MYVCDLTILVARWEAEIGEYAEVHQSSDSSEVFGVVNKKPLQTMQVGVTLIQTDRQV